MAYVLIRKDKRETDLSVYLLKESYIITTIKQFKLGVDYDN